MVKYNVIVQTDLVDVPKEHELSAALILAYHFKTDVIFLRPETKKTPDIDVNGTKWEIKSPRGNGKKTIDNNLRAAHKQSLRCCTRSASCQIAPKQGNSSYKLLPIGWAPQNKTP